MLKDLTIEEKVMNRMEVQERIAENAVHAAQRELEKAEAALEAIRTAAHEIEKICKPR